MLFNKGRHSKENEALYTLALWICSTNYHSKSHTTGFPPLSSQTTGNDGIHWRGNCIPWGAGRARKPSQRKLLYTWWRADLTRSQVDREGIGLEWSACFGWKVAWTFYRSYSIPLKSRIQSNVYTVVEIMLLDQLRHYPNKKSLRRTHNEAFRRQCSCHGVSKEAASFLLVSGA